MDIQEILAAIDSEISKLQQVRAILTDSTPKAALVPGKRPVGRPKKIATAVPAVPATKKRVMSEDARARIAAAQKKRWAAAKKAA
jgi:hypothetical protein